ATIAHPLVDALDAPARGGVRSGVDALDLDAGGPALRLHELFDQLAAMAGAQHEAAKTLHGVDLDDVPQDRAVPDPDQWLGQGLALALQARAAAAAQDDDGSR